ncbi:hypothetical protein J5681_09215 [bacterium]|nr:hypothetical protein [bacterium]
MTDKIKLKYVDFWSGYEPTTRSLFKAIQQTGREIEFSDDPDYLICSVFGHEVLDRKYDNCVKILLTGENVCPDFNLYDYAIGFEYLDFGDRYLRFPNYYDLAYKSSWDKLLLKHTCYIENFSKKEFFCSFVYSNGNADPIREQFFQELSKYKPVNSGGKYLNNIGLPNGVPDKIEFESNHKFSIAFENSFHPGYTTEKLIQSFAAGTVPIYWGDPRIKEVFNPDSFICVHDFTSLDQVIKKIKELDENDELYLKYLSSPAILNSNFNRETQIKKLNTFIENIFNQKKEKTFRRNKLVWGEKYLDYMNKSWTLFKLNQNKTKTLNSLADKLKNITSIIKNGNGKI